MLNHLKLTRMPILSALELKIIYFVILIFGFSNPLHANELDFNADTRYLAGTHGSLIFDFISGNNTTANSVILSNFSSDGQLGIVTSQGDSTGNLHSTVNIDTKNALLNELAQSFVFGNKLSFVMNFTQNAADISNTPDSFAFYFLNSSAISMPNTTDPTGNNAIFQYNITDSRMDNLNTFLSNDLPITWQVSNVSSTAVPLQTASWYFLSGMLMPLLIGKRSKKLIKL